MAEASEPLELILHSRGDTRRLGHALARCLSPGDLLLLEGELGAGKTFLARAIARGLDVPSEVRITSPTFDLVHELPARIPLVHVDLYRIDAGADLLELGLLDRIGGDAIVLIEWGARFARELAGSGLSIRVERDRGSGRQCTVAPHGPRGPDLLARVRTSLETRTIHGPRCTGGFAPRH
jgi:tRNA threonylcarbamoyladenosine biosynthesis protein TsaE